MQVEYAFLADFAQTPPDGKLYVVGGGIDEIRAATFPFKHPLFSLVVKFKLEPIECGRQHALEIELWNPDGQPIGGKVQGQFGAERRVDEPARPCFVSLVINLMGLEFTQPGDYAFHIAVDGREEKVVPLFIRAIGEKALSS